MAHRDIHLLLVYFLIDIYQVDNKFLYCRYMLLSKMMNLMILCFLKNVNMPNLYNIHSE